MIDYTAIDEFTDPVQIYDLSDLVLGGEAGASNQPIEKLINRTIYLFNRLGGYKDVADVTGNTAIDNTFANKLISVVKSGGDVTLTIAALNTFVKGNRIAFVANMSGASGPYWVNITTADNVSDGSTILTSIYLYDGEMIELVAGASVWHWTVNKTNYAKGIGEAELKRYQPRNTFLGDGTSGFLRARYPRLIPVISSSFVTDANWLGDTFRYRGQFSSGNGTTTFRAADYRAMFFRALDGGRGADIGRLDAVVGGYEADAIKSFTAQFAGASAALEGGNSGVPNVDVISTNIVAPFNGGAKTINKDFTVTGAGTEVRVKSVGFNPYIYY